MMPLRYYNHFIPLGFKKAPLLEPVLSLALGEIEGAEAG